MIRLKSKIQPLPFRIVYYLKPKDSFDVPTRKEPANNYSAALHTIRKLPADAMRADVEKASILRDGTIYWILAARMWKTGKMIEVKP